MALRRNAATISPTTGAALGNAWSTRDEPCTRLATPGGHSTPRNPRGGPSPRGAGSGSSDPRTHRTAALLACCGRRAFRVRLAAPSGRLRGCPTPLDHMGEGENGMADQHPRPGVTHHFPNPLACCRFVAVDRTVRAGRLVFIERAVCDPLRGVLREFRARGAQPVGRCVIVAAEQSDHVLHGPALTGQPACFRHHARKGV